MSFVEDIFVIAGDFDLVQRPRFERAVLYLTSLPLVDSGRELVVLRFRLFMALIQDSLLLLLVDLALLSKIVFR